MKKRIAIIGAGFSGLSAASYLSKAGLFVDVYDMHDIPGGRARQFITENGYIFDMGPSWYWMPDVIEKYFEDMEVSRSRFFDLVTLNPQFDIVFEDEVMSVPESFEELTHLIDKYEGGSSKKLDAFILSAQKKYQIGMENFVYKPNHSWIEYFDKDIIRSSLKLDLLTSFRKYINNFFKNDKIRKLMEFPVIFLGASPKDIPSLYSMMNYGGYVLGTYYPMGGFYKLIDSMYTISINNGVNFYFNHPIKNIKVDNKSGHLSLFSEKSSSIKDIKYDYVIGSGDYHHIESLLPVDKRNYNDEYWKNRTFAPSCLIFYIGLNKKLPKIHHHTLFFDAPFDKHINDVYEHKKWTEDPLFYVCCPSKTDDSVAPVGHENLFFLMPLPINAEDTEELRNTYFELMLARLEKYAGEKGLENHIDYKRSYCVKDFKSDYHAYGGNAYGLANTLRQTGPLKPKIRNKYIDNLYYAGQLTVPGPGVPPSIISGKIVANEILKRI